MDFSVMETGVLIAALKNHVEFCEDCLKNLENKNQFIYIQGDMELSQSLLARLTKYSIDNNWDNFHDKD